jgi:hypothetical protein
VLLEPARLTLDTSSSERRAFLVRLRGDPIFLLKHIPALSAAIFRRFRTRMAIAISTPHRGRKRWPTWVGARGSLAAPATDRAITAAGLPSYPAPSSRAAYRSATDRSLSNETSADPEDQFAQHRWGFLLAALLQHPVDWQRCIGQCIRWIEINSDQSQQAWEPYSASERVANLVVFLAAMPADLRQREIAPELLQFLDRSIDWIYGHLEYYGPLQTNNHIVDNARALVLGGIATNNAAAVGAGMRIFRRWLPELILSGGFLRERSSHYQLVVLNWLIDAWHFQLAHAGRDSADTEILRDYTARMLSAASMMCDAEGQLLTLVGDVSPDATPDWSAARLALLYPQSWPAPLASRAPLEIRDGWFRISGGRDLVLGNFPAGRYPLQFPTHGHCDFTGFAWINGTSEILVDPGRYRYTPDAVSIFQAGAAAHNLPTINGLAPLCESLLTNGRWWPRPYADAELLLCEREGAVVLTHDGFARATPVTRHERKIVVHDRELIVQDALDGRGSVIAGWCWHFGSGFDRFDAGDLIASGECGQLSMVVQGPSGMPRVEPASGAVPGSWRSGSYGQKHPGLGVCLHWSINLPAVVSTRFRLKLSEGWRP